MGDAAGRGVVWFKRDLRLADHAPLAEAAARGLSLLGVVVLEDTWLASPEFDAQHLAFWREAVVALQADAAARGLAVVVLRGDLPGAFEALHARWPFAQLFSHEETGPFWSYDRDRAVAAWCRTRGVAWHELPQTGVVRRLKSRQGWAARWQSRMDAPLATPPAQLPGARLRSGQPAPPPTRAELALPAPRPVPAAGAAAAQAVLASFLATRGQRYRRDLSSPLSAEHGCSRLSAHLAFGTVSMRQVHQATEARIAALAAGDADERRFAHALRGFAGRLRWHCHFMQKLEDEPEIERRNFARAYDGLREPWPDGAEAQRRFQAWCEGRTGYPMVDACMRQLRATGWLNFRMRAMLVSFAAYHLWLHWRAPGLFLARQFLDFEPGIHWSQMQMQSGTTGINTLRIYSPRKQAADHDPTGAYVRRWVPELGSADYPPPVVDERVALKHAKDTLFALRGTRAAQDEADAIQQRHGSRRSGLAPSAGAGPRSAPRARRAPSATAAVQPDLFAVEPPAGD